MLQRTARSCPLDFSLVPCRGLFMGLLVQCHRCGTINGESICPKCGSIEFPAEAARQRGIIEGYRQRKQQFKHHQAISLGLVFGLVATTTALLVVVWTTRFWELVFGLAYDPQAAGRNTGLAGLLGAASVVLSLLCLKSKALWPGELMCPACEFRLDDCHQDIVYCPCCAVYLGCPGAKHGSGSIRAPFARNRSARGT